MSRNKPDGIAADRQSMALGANEQANWVGLIRPSKALFWSIAVTTAALGIASLLSFSQPEGQAFGFVMAALCVLFLVIAVSTLWFRVRIDGLGVEVRSTAGWPVFKVAIGDIARVKSAQISPFSEFGGWGLRYTLDSFAIVMRTGDALVITRNGGRRFVLSVDDSARAAAALAAFVQQSEDDASTRRAQ